MTVTYQGPKRQYYDVLLKYKKKSKRWTGNFTVNKGMEKGSGRSGVLQQIKIMMKSIIIVVITKI